MSNDHAPAAGQGGKASVSESQASAPRPDGEPAPGPPYVDALSKSDEELRRLAVARLAEHLDIGSGLIARCEELANFRKGDRLRPLYAAARLMKANAQVAKALAQVAQIESRRRSIVERIQPPGAKFAELNSRLAGEETDSRRKLKIWRRMNEIVDNSIRARSGEAGAEDRAAYLVKTEQETLARIQKERAAADPSYSPAPEEDPRSFGQNAEPSVKPEGPEGAQEEERRADAPGPE